MMAYRFLGNVIISGKIKCETALHVGGTVEGYEIGGMDNPIIRDPATGYPYIPGSSLKGKMRSLLEWSKGLVQVATKSESGKELKVGEVHVCGSSDCPVCRSFGAPAEQARTVGPTRLLVRDAYPTEETKTKLDKLQLERGLPKAEWKYENVINRVTAQAMPRPIERVPQGSEFRLEMVYGIYEVNGETEVTDLDHLQYVFESMRLLEDSALGGYGSRGSGKVSFELAKVTLRLTPDYEQGLPGTDLTILPLREVKFDELKTQIQDKLPKRDEGTNPQA
jgi:CRISPR-associated protein Csm3